MGLRLRLTLWLVIPLLAVMGAHGWVRVRDEQGQILEINRRSMATTARAIQIALETALRDDKTFDMYRLLVELTQSQEQIDRIRVFDRTFAQLVVSSDAAVGEAVAGPPLQRVFDTGQPVSRYERRDGELLLLHYEPVSGPGGRAYVAMEVLQIAADVDARLRSTVWDLILRLGLVAIAVGGMMVVVVQHQMFRPLRRLMEGIRAVGQGGTPALPIRRRDELGRLAEAFNEMTVQLEAAGQRVAAESERALDLEQQLRQAETLAVAGRLASGIAHEVGTPLNIISGRAEFLLAGLARDDERRRELEGIVEQIDRISAIIRGLLDVVRPKKAEVRAVAVTEVLDGLWPLMDHAARRRSLVLDADVPASLPCVLADPRQVQQVLINLLVNAFAASRPGAAVTVGARAAAHDGRDGVWLSVMDSGHGIPPDDLPRVFQPFFTTRSPGEGTGLGLAICRDIVRAHGGDIKLDSREGAGTTVGVWLPAVLKGRVAA